jgi:hypothetical protein
MFEMVWESTEPCEANAAVPRKGVPAWLLSVMLHVTGVLLLAFLPQTTSRQIDTKSDRVAGIVLVQRNRSKTEYLNEDSLDLNTSVVSSSKSAPSLALPSMNQAAAPAIAVALPTTTGSLSPSATMPTVDGFIAANKPSRHVGGGQASTQVFGAQGTGSRFVYVFDRSSSMRGYQGRPMAAARTELIKSLESIESIHQFQIVFYNDKTSVFNPYRPGPPRLMFGTEENKALAAAFIRNVMPAGSTRHLDPLRQALGMQPDVIFFLTDAAEPQLTPDELHEIQSRNRSGAVINTIEFGSGPFQGGDNFLVKLARQNGGKHVYVDVTRLSR